MNGPLPSPRQDALLLVSYCSRPGASWRGVRLREAPGFSRGEHVTIHIVRIICWESSIMVAIKHTAPAFAEQDALTVAALFGIRGNVRSLPAEHPVHFKSGE